MNRNELEKLSDVQLSLAILKNKCGGLAESYRISKVNTTARCLVGTNGRGSLTVSFDVNDWSDMGALITGNKLSIEPDAEGESWISTNLDISISYKCANPLRAAAIVYLLMQGENNE